MQPQNINWPHRLTARTPGFHPGNRSSILRGVTKESDSSSAREGLFVNNQIRYNIRINFMTHNSEKIFFELLCFDLDNKCPFGSDTNKFALNLNSNTKLFSAKTQATENTLKDDGVMLSVNLVESNVDVDYKTAFIIRVEFSRLDDEKIDQFKLDLVEYLANLQFGKIYITKDDLSKKILTNLYPLVNSLENNLRSYVTKYLSIKEGVSSWFVRSVGEKVRDKISRREGNENIFSKINTSIDTQIFLIDFEDLGDIIYSNSFGNHKISDLVEKIENANDLSALQKMVQRNSDKYFQSFKDISFDYKWKHLKSIRHKIAHNGLINLEEFNISKSYIGDLSRFIEKLDDGLAEIKFSAFEVERSFYNDSTEQYKDISKNELLNELKSYKDWSDSIGRDFLSLKNFLHNRLGGSKGYHIGKAWDKLEELETDGYISIDIWHDENGQYPDQKKINILKELPIYTA